MIKKKIDYLLYAATYVFKTQVLRKEIPFIGGLVINERCNLRCRQCKVANRDIPDLSFADVKKGLDTFYRMGIRSIFLEGGEPFLWQDNDRRLEDIVKTARKTGFKVVSVYTNGTFPIVSSADAVFVSLDGLKETNNYLRGDFYDTVINNINVSSHPNIIINFTINRLNEAEIELFCESVSQMKKARGVFFYFHTPYYGIDDLFLNIEKKREVIRRILDLKRKRFRILNSKACLKAVYKDTWKRPSKLCYVYADNKLYQCCRAIGNAQSCANCGYLGYPEIIQILKLCPSAVFEALNYLPGG